MSIDSAIPTRNYDYYSYVKQIVGNNNYLNVNQIRIIIINVHYVIQYLSHLQIKKDILNINVYFNQKYNCTYCP